MKTIRILFIVALSISCSAQDKNSYLGFTAGSDITGHYVAEVNMVYKNAEVTVGYDAKIDLDYSRSYFGVGYQFPLYAYPGGNEIKTLLGVSAQPSLIDRKDTWGGAFVDDNTSSHLSIALNVSFSWDINEKLMFGIHGNFLPATDLKAKFPKELWNEQIVIADTPIRSNVFLKITYRINY